MKKMLLILGLVVQLFSDTRCMYHGYEINEKYTGKDYIYDLTCYRGVCSISESGRVMFQLEERVVRSRHLTNCQYLKKEVYNFNKYVRR